MLTTSSVRASPQQVSKGLAPLQRLWIETSVTSSATTTECLAIIGGIVPTTANNSIRADSTSNKPTNDSARVVGSKRRMEAAEEVFGVHITKPPP